MSMMLVKYFTLKPEGDTAWAKASRTAMRVFATEIESTDKVLSAELKQWAYQEERKLQRVYEEGEVEGDY